MRVSLVPMILIFATTSANATTCSEAVARCKVEGASKPYIETSCKAAGASCMKTGKFVGPITNTAFKGVLVRK
jgi:hypothetical protein